MYAIRARSLLVTAVACAVCLACTTGARAQDAPNWFINKDYLQTDTRSALSLTWILNKLYADKDLGGGNSAKTNAFAMPKRTSKMLGVNETQVTFTSSNGTGLGTNSNPPTPYHFGLSGSGADPALTSAFYTYPKLGDAPITVALPDPDINFTYFPKTGMLRIIVKNLSSDTITMSQAGFLMETSAIPLDGLNRTNLPPTDFMLLPSYVDRQYTPGQSSDPVFLTGFSPSDFIVTFDSTVFSGASSSNPYTASSGEWTEVSIGANSVPEPSSLVLTGIGILGLLGYACHRWVTS
jgi:hypothetical protein